MEGGKGNRLHMDGNKGTVIVGTVITTIVGPLEVTELAWKGFGLNNSSTATFVSGVVERAPESTGPWGTLDGTSFNTLGSAVYTIGQYANEVSRFLRVRGAVASGSVATVMYWLQA